MKIFFDASLTGKNEYQENYEKIVEIIKKYKYTLIESTLFSRKHVEVGEESSEEAGEWYKKLKKWVHQSDVCVFEVTYPSTGIGHEVSVALSMGKPVIALYVEGKDPYVLESIPDDRLLVIDYTMSTLSNVLRDAIEYAADQQDTRFNFFISPKHQHYLDWVAKNKKVPRAVFLRKLIEDDMKKNADFS